MCLQIIDPELYDHLTKNQLTAEIYAFSCKYMSYLKFKYMYF